jgi:hypothetical protein
VVCTVALPTQPSQRSVASAIKTNAASTANNGIVKRLQKPLAAGGGFGIGATGEDGA